MTENAVTFDVFHGGVASAVGPAANLSEAEDDLAAMVRDLLDPASWTIAVRDIWAQASPIGQAVPVQGWKLHVSATPGSVKEVLRQVAAVVRAQPCAFKVARSTMQVRQLTGPHADRVQAGKILALYPKDDAAALRLGLALAQATEGLPGPRILTDRPVRPGSTVQYRYGAFLGALHIAADGMMSAGLRAPDGTVVVDPREPRFSPPTWAVDPFAASTPAKSGTSGVST